MKLYSINKKFYSMIFMVFCTGFITYSPEPDHKVALNKFSDLTIREINNFKNERQTFSILPFLYHVKASYREEAALAFGSLQDTIVINYLLPLLNDTDAGVRRATVFAVAQIGATNIEGNLLNAYYAEKDNEIKASILTAMGKCANDRILISFNMLNLKDSTLSAGLAWGIYYAGLKDKTSEALLKKSIKMLENSFGQDTRLAVAHYLSRTKNIDLSPYGKEISAALASETMANIRMPLSLALAKTGSSEAEAQLKKLVVSDPDYRVKVNALKALESIEQAGISKEIYQALSDKNISTAVASAEYIKSKAQENDVPEILKQAEKAENWRVNALLLSAALKNGPDAALEEKIWSRYKKSKNNYEKGALLKALAFNPNNNKEISKEIFQTKEPVLKTYGIEALVEAFEGSPKQELRKEYYDILKKAVESDDIALIGTSAVAMRNPGMEMQQYISNPTFLFQARDNLKLPQEIETYQEIQKTIDYVTNTQTKPQPITLNYLPIDWNLISGLSNNEKVVIKTSKGDFTMELMVEDAPSTVGNFLKLSGKNFYDGKKFHRVVPNFVVQGGDPRGDGWGSSENIIRSEFTNYRFDEGYIGMASAGKDTESCQWFITHSPAPHLDGRYTNFARIISGMAVVHQLEAGDIIKSINKVP